MMFPTKYDSLPPIGDNAHHSSDNEEIDRSCIGGDHDYETLNENNGNGVLDRSLSNISQDPYDSANKACQTKWSWLEDMRRMGSFVVDVESIDNENDFQDELDAIHGSNECTESSSRISVVGSSIECSTARKVSLKENSRRSSKISNLNGATEISRSENSQRNTSTSQRDLVVYPLECVDDTYGIPIDKFQLETNILSDFDSDQSEASYNLNSDRQKGTTWQGDTIGGVGPPRLLQYQRESQRPSMEIEDPISRHIRESLAAGKFDMETVNFSFSELMAHKDFASLHLDAAHIARLIENEQAARDDLSDTSLFSGVCEFCQRKILPLPTVQEQLDECPSKLFCCEEYKDFLLFALNVQKEEENKYKEQIGNLDEQTKNAKKMHDKSGESQAERKMRERVLRQHQLQIAGLQQRSMARKGPLQDGVPGEIVKSMRTINYQLSSLKCFEEGWTLRAPSPLNDARNRQTFDIEPVWPHSFGPSEWFSTTVSDNDYISSKEVVEKFYEDGSKFLTVFKDGTGNLFYPSGNLCVLVIVSYGQYMYHVYDDNEEHSLLAMFSPTGQAACYFRQTGHEKVVLTEWGGVEFTDEGQRRRSWSWIPETLEPDIYSSEFFDKLNLTALWNEVPHKHVPPLRPLCFILGRHLGLHIITQNNILLVFASGTRSHRFNVGTHLTKVRVGAKPPVDEQSLAEKAYVQNVQTKVRYLRHKIETLQRLPHSEKADLVHPPKYLSSGISRISFVNDKFLNTRGSTRESKSVQRQISTIIS